MGRAGKAAHVGADLGQNVLRVPPANTGYRVQPLDGFFKRGHAPGDLLTQTRDLGVQKVKLILAGQSDEGLA